MENEIKEDCYWYKQKTRWQKECRVLVSLQCKNNGACSFYETEAEYKARQKRFSKRENGFCLFSHL